MVSKNYTTVIIGSGPAGLAFANYSLEANPKQKIVIIEKDKSIGGCHKVNRQKYENEYYFSEHGPRIYIDNYVNFIHLLKKMNLNFYELFEKAISFVDISNEILFKDSTFTISEFLYILRDFIFVLFVNNHGIDKTIKEYMDENNFSQKTKDKIDLLSRSFDGGGSDRISLNQYLNFSLESLLYSSYLPRIPNDEGLFRYWRKYLEVNNVDFILNNGVKDLIDSNDNKKEIKKVVLEDGTEITGDRFILAMPPENIVHLLEKTNDKIKGSFGDYNGFKEMTEKTKYDDYISIAFHWDSKITVDETIPMIKADWGFKTEWGVIVANLTKVMTFKEIKSKSVFSCAIIFTDRKSSRINKTANECKDPQELFEEVFYQLKLIHKNLPKPTLYFINNRYDEKEKKWSSNEEAYIKTPKVPFIPFESNIYKNLYNLGTHNGKQKISYTTLESAVSNSLKLANIIYKQKRRVKRGFDLRDLTVLILSIIILLLLIRYTYYY